MVKLVRTYSILDNWEEVQKNQKELNDYLKKNYSEIKDGYFLMGITGPINEFHWVLDFESLADEEIFATKVVEDSRYLETMKSFAGSASMPIDHLYRSFS
jgi:hypothetical protein